MTTIGRIRQSASMLCLFMSACNAGADPAAASSPFVERFDAPRDASDWTVSTYAHPGGWIQTRWSEDQIDWSETGEVTIRLVPSDANEIGKPFVSGELKRQERTYYGRYEVVMRAARGSGLNSTFFTYTGPHQGDPHDEIDFEFLGRTPTKVWLNYYVNGDAQMEGPTELGFDASAAAHHYAFTWTEHEIRWYADGQLIAQVGADDPSPPKTPSEIYLSLWAGSPQWLGYAAPDTTANATYYCVAYSPDVDGSPLCSAPNRK